ncbi:hypothetical protein ACV4QK_20585 (plasmid) [Alteromonas macleodii]
MTKKLKTLQESSMIMIGVSAIAIVISLVENFDGLSYSKIMLLLVSVLLFCFAVQTYFTLRKQKIGEECNEHDG